MAVVAGSALGACGKGASVVGAVVEGDGGDCDDGGVVVMVVLAVMVAIVAMLLARFCVWYF